MASFDKGGDKEDKDENNNDDGDDDDSNGEDESDIKSQRLHRILLNFLHGDFI